MTKLDVYGNEGGFSIWIDTPHGKQTVAVYGKLRVEEYDEYSITISKGPGVYHTREFYITITRDAINEGDLYIFMQTGSVSQTRLVYNHVLDDAKWREIITAARKAEAESGREVEQDQEEYESE